jgi:hypothetical protein
MMKKVVSLLLALVMAVGLCTSAIAETNGESEDVQTGNETYTMETVLAGVDALTGNEAEKTAIKDYLNTYFVVVDNENGFFFVINNVGLRRDKFIQTQEQKVTVQDAVNGYNAQIGETNRSIAAILDAYQVKYGNGTRTFENLMGMYTAALNRPAVQINEGSNGPDTGKVQGVHLLKCSDGTDGYPYNNQGYVSTDDVTAAGNYFVEYFSYMTWETGDGEKYNTVTFKDGIYDKGTNKITDQEKAKAAISAYNQLSPAVQVLLNELEIRVATGPSGTEQFRFWRLIQHFDKQLNGSQGSGNNPSHGPTTGNITDVKSLPDAASVAGTQARDFLGGVNDSTTGIVKYTYTPGGNDKAPVGDISINGTDIGNDGMFTDTAKARAAINAYYNLQPAARDILDMLFLREETPWGAQLWKFSHRMANFESMVQIAESKGDDSVKTDPLSKENGAAEMLRSTGGFTAPDLGRNFTITFPRQLERGKDYNYNYQVVDGVGVLTVEMYAGNKQHWIEAGLANPEGIKYTVVLRNPTNGIYHGAAAGNGNSGVWDAWAKGTIALNEYTDEMEKFSFGLAAVNTRDGFMTVNAIENYGEMMVLSVWNSNKNMNEGSPVKNLVLVRIRVVDQFSYEAEAGMVPAVNVKDKERVKVTGVNAEIWNVTREAERLVVRPKDGTLASIFEAEKKWENIGTLTVAAPMSDYKLAAVNGKQISNGGDTWTCKQFFPQSNGQNGPGTATTRTFTLTWVSGDAQYDEQFTLYIGEMATTAQDRFSQIVNAGSQSSVPVVAPSEEFANEAMGKITAGSGLDVTYDKSTGRFQATFDGSKGLPSLADLDKGFVLVPDDAFKGKVAGFHTHPFESTGDPAEFDADWFKMVKLGFDQERSDPNRTNSYPENTVARTIPFVATNRLVRDGVTIYFAFTQNYRGMVIEWVDANNTVLGYTIAYGKNGPFVMTTKTEVSENEPEHDKTYNEPFAVAEGGGEFWCERYPQEGGNGQKWYFRLRVSGRQQGNGEYTVYLPYSYLEITDAEAQRLINSGRKAWIDHYVNGDGMAPETLEGTYTEWGICFKTRSFSPFVISTAAQSSSGGGYYYGGASTPGISAVKTADAAKSATDYTSGIYGLTFRSTAAFSGFKGVQVDGRTIASANYLAEDNGGIEVYLKAVYLRTLKDGRHTVTILSDAGNVTMNFTIGGVDSPTTFDAGIGAYVGMALASVGGMAWMRRRKR